MAKEKIKVFDEVQFKEDGAKFVVTAIHGNCLYGINANGDTFSSREANYWKRTGRSFPQLAEILTQMKGEK